VAEFRLSKKARQDLDDIADYTYETFGELQADKYGEELLSAFLLLAERPRIGKAVSGLISNLRSFPFQAHVIYYNAEGNGIFIVRILHSGQDPARHL
jgi:toxin ParE1/3/4